MARPGEVARQWFIPGEGIDRHVISTDIQRYLGNDATVRPGVGTGDYQGVHGYWIKAYRNLTSAMIADLRADSIRWRQEQRQTGGAGESYVGSRTYDQSNAARINRPRDTNSPSLDDYAGPPPPRQGDGRGARQPVDPMQIDAPPSGRASQGQYGQGFFPSDARGGQYPPEPSGRGGFPQSRGGPGYPDQSMVDAYGQPDAYGRFPVPQYPPDRSGRGYGSNPQPPPSGYTQQGEYYVPMTSGYPQSSMMATAGADPSYYGRQSQPQPRGGGPEQPGQPGRGQRGDPNYGQPEYNPYPSPAQTVLDPNPRGAAPPSGFGSQGSYDQFGRPVSNPSYGQYPPEPNYPPPGREVRQSAPTPRESDRRHRRNG